MLLTPEPVTIIIKIYLAVNDVIDTPIGIAATGEAFGPVSISHTFNNGISVMLRAFEHRQET